MQPTNAIRRTKYNELNLSSAEMQPADVDLVLTSTEPIRVSHRTGQQIGRAVAIAIAHLYGEIFAALKQTRSEAGQKLIDFVQINTDPVKLIENYDDLRILVANDANALLSLIERNVLEFVVRTPESEAALVKLRAHVDAFWPRQPLESAAAAAVTVEPTESDLDRAAISEWRSTSTDAIKRHMKQDAAFDARINRLMAENRI